ncbi:hypothetical protein L3Q65_07005 [Amycolatopsis sp. FU40]|uniref:hypothetical protein n=1 Tax=Amycolatopsis sp. FU40 TaxID=2914159 RepID=UPI001F269F08|nr:hypothetical protein [Amycolatopsis sp. FU40]UKD56462.1 hypothetical protein L3Q65_07005 [Amycolatopsis sp. FU40]
MLVRRCGVGAESLAAAFGHPDRPVHTIGLPGTALQLAVRRLPLSLGERKAEVRFAHPAASATRPGAAELLGNAGDLRKALALD